MLGDKHVIDKLYGTIKCTCNSFCKKLFLAKKQIIYGYIEVPLFNFKSEIKDVKKIFYGADELLPVEIDLVNLGSTN